MGWVYGFHILDPEMVREVLALSASAIRQRLVDRGFSPEQVGVESWADEDIDENEALTLLATSREWDIDKSLDDIQAIPGLDPRLAPLRLVLREMESFDSSKVPRRFHPRETGLMGIAMPSTLAVAALAAAPFVGPEGRRALTEGKISLVERLLGVASGGG